MKRIVSKRWLALLTAALLVFALLPGAALADEPVAQIGTTEGTTEYDSLTDALSAAGEGQIVKVIANTTVSGSFELTTTITLDLNGKTVDWTTSDSVALNVTAGTLTIQDSATGGALNITSTSTKANAYGICARGGNLVLKSGTVSYSTTTNGSACAAIATGGTSGLTMEGGTVKLLQTADDIVYAYGVFAAGNGVHSFTGGTVELGSGVKADNVYGVCVAMFSSGKPTSIDALTVDASQVPASSEVLCVRGGTSSPMTSVSSGVYKVNDNPESQPAATGGKSNLQIPSMAKIGSTDFFVGPSIAENVAKATSDDTIEVVIGNLDLTNLPAGVTVKNSGTGTVSVNGEPVAPGEEVTVESELLYSIVKQPTDSIVTEGDAATFTVVAEGRDVMLGYQWRKSTDGGKTFKVIDGANAASYTTSATTLQNDGYQYDCIVFDANWQTVRANNAPSLTDADIKDMTEGQDYLRSKVVTLHVKEAGAEEPEPGEPVVPPTGDSPLLYAAIGAAVLCLLGLCLPALRKNRG